MEKSESIKNVTSALFAFQKLVGKIPKDSKNPFFKSVYASLPDILDKIHEPLLESGLIVSQWPTGLHELTTMVSHAETGEFIMETYQMPPAKNDPQGIGSSITYQRRYAIGAVLNLNIDIDDDGNNASGLNATSTQEAPEPELPWLNSKDTDNWNKVVTAMKGGYTLVQVRSKYKVSKATEKELTEAVNTPA